MLVGWVDVFDTTGRLGGLRASDGKLGEVIRDYENGGRIIVSVRDLFPDYFCSLGSSLLAESFRADVPQSLGRQAPWTSPRRLTLCLDVPILLGTMPPPLGSKGPANHGAGIRVSFRVVGRLKRELAERGRSGAATIGPRIEDGWSSRPALWPSGEVRADTRLPFACGDAARFVCLCRRRLIRNVRGPRRWPPVRTRAKSRSRRWRGSLPRERRCVWDLQDGTGGRQSV